MNATDMQDQAGAADNRLSINPNDDRWADVLAAWKDGQTYSVQLDISQVSPGEFEVTGLQEAGGGEAEAGAEAETPAETTAEGGVEESGQGGGAGAMEESGYPNPAVRKMMKNQRQY